ncbi:MAG: bifunctional D-glycero-beta-D-manno-heptose-7-phosphate kinase/D-glycero-beta-D-manno-heptose 1-phosphate adenylyltransferase HldE [Pseudomonadota bacterium]
MTTNASTDSSAAAAAFPELPPLQRVHVLVFGDLMLDRYWHGPAQRISQEAPVPVVAVERVVDRPGGAANVALNVAALGARCTLVGVVGDDAAGVALRQTLAAAGVECEFVTAADYATPLKIRVVSGQQILRADFEQSVPAAAAQRALDAALRLAGAGVDALVIEDYDKGTVAAAGELIAACGAPVVVDPKTKPLTAYAGATVVKPNVEEAGRWLDAPADDQALATLRAEHDVGALVITRGAQGMLVADAAGALSIPARRVDVFDVTGAGDTVAACLGTVLAAGLDVRAAARLANLAGSVVVAKEGTATVSAPELRALMRAEARVDRGLLRRERLLAAISEARARGEVIVFTNGCFDILHAGHVGYLEEARELGDRLVVALNTDASVRRLKGEGRPVNPLDRRAQVIGALAAVDWVVAFDEDTPESLLEALRPDVLVKGGDYTPAEVVGAGIVEAYGGAVRVLSLVPDVSTSGLIDRLRDG